MGDLTHCSNKIQSFSFRGLGPPSKQPCTYKGDACEEDTKAFYLSCCSVVNVPEKKFPLYLYGDEEKGVVKIFFQKMLAAFVLYMNC